MYLKQFAGLLALAWTSLSVSSYAQPIHQVSAQTCKLCHKEVYKQWKGSMHAQSTALKDPIHGTFYKKVVGDPTKEGVKHKASGKFPVCLNCHAPNAAKDKTTKLDAKPAYSEGVNCVVCHTLKKYKGIDGENGKLRLGIKAYETSDKIQGPGRHSNRGLQNLTAANDMFGGAGGDEQKPNPHLGEPVTMDGQEVPALPMESNPLQVKTSDACMGCHDKRNNPHGVALCQTGKEFDTSQAKVSCLSCHMPINGQVADHSMSGGHHLATLQRAVVFDISGNKTGDSIKTTVILKNQQPHSLPTGAPFRNIYMKLTAYDTEGNVVWENAKGHPAKTDPQAYLVYKLEDDKGKPAPPPTAKQSGEDTRLNPYEERSLSYDIPAKGVVLVRGELYYNLLWPGLVKKFKHLPEDLVAPQMIASAEFSL
ncbi:cytochrome c family protein [Candidatus Venteria ishoeyi]|uniref:Cytochrome c-552/4 domain-containing protein n=1 Tax=Candidatus Venteria ishoeyi TaxID=1899563 RepID=A0A1H6FIR6_9GAMM|nr:cytochrome c family protein [Candidatus Venteria ishoeyi]MDM8546585.1 cytochrome c family protein [Candidatus Venteria ishoeyi]SEH08945.1 Uncharacterised protein [Candidatus Venteria ishoeyi]